MSFTSSLVRAGPQCREGIRLRSPSRNQHLGAHDESSIGLELRQSSTDLFSYCTSTALGQREIGSWNLPGPCFDRPPVVVEGLDRPLPYFSLDSDVVEVGRAKETLKPRCVCQRKAEVQRLALIWKIATQHIGENAPHPPAPVWR